MPEQAIYERQNLIKDLKIPKVASVVGVGGTGFWTGLLLAMSGVEELILIDSDYLNEANLNEIILRLSTLNCIQEDQYKNEFYQLVGNYLENIRND